MIYFDRESLEAFTGFASTDMKDAGKTMTATVWESFVEELDRGIAGWMHRWCGVPTFGSHLVTEYHDGRGQNGIEYDSDLYAETDRLFFLRESATGDPVVYTDTAIETASPSWVKRQIRCATTGGDFTYFEDEGLGVVRFHTNVPLEGYKNVKIEYWAGFEEGSEDLEQIRIIAKRLAGNLLNVKKKFQEVQTVRNTGVRDYSQMFDLETDRKVFTPELEMMLTRYRRYQFGSGGFR